MAIFKPENKSTPSGFLGPIEVGIIGFTDRSGEYDWADVFIEVELSVKNSEYSNKMSILGRLDKDSNGDIVGGSVLNRMYKMFEAMGCQAGLNVKGAWEDEHGNAIENIGSFLSERYKAVPSLGMYLCKSDFNTNTPLFLGELTAISTYIIDYLMRYLLVVYHFVVAYHLHLPP